MKKMKSNQLFLKAVMLNLGMVLAFSFFYSFSFEAPDDSIMSTILYGGYGYYTPYDVFQNIILTKIITKLIAWFPGVAWYTLAQTITVFVSLTLVTYMVLQQNCKKLRTIIWTMVLIFLWYEFYGKMQFTKTAAIASIAGILLVYEVCMGKSKRKVLTTLLAIVMCAVGIMWRAQAFGMVFGVTFAIGLVDLIKCIQSKTWKRIGVYIVGVCILGILYVGLTRYHNYVYAQNQQWNEYFEFNQYRGVLLDYGWPDYSENKELYDSLGISQEDIDVFDRWNYADPEVFTVDMLKQLVQVKMQTKTPVTKLIREYLPQVWKHIYESVIFVPWILLIIISMFLQSKKSMPYILYGMVVTLALDVYFLCAGRGLLNRIDVGIVSANAIVLALIPWDEEREKKIYPAIVAASIGFVVLRFPVSNKIYDYTKQETLKNDVALMNGNQEAIYYTEEYTVDEYEKTTAGMWERPEIGIYSNISRLGGWKYPSPDALGVSAKYGIVNPYKQMVDNPNVYLVCNKKELVDKIEAYIKRHYNSNARAIKRKELGEAKVYQIVTKTPRVDVTTAIEDEKVVGSISNISQGENGGLQIKGEIYVPGTNSYNEKIYMRVRNVLTDKTDWFNVTQYCENKAKSITEGQYGGFIKEFENYSLDDIENLEFEMYVQVDGKVYKKTMSKE